MKKIQRTPEPMERRLIVAIVASAIFAGVFVGLIMIGYRG